MNLRMSFRSNEGEIRLSSNKPEEPKRVIRIECVGNGGYIYVNLEDMKLRSMWEAYQNEKFNLIYNDNGTISLLSLANNKYVSADENLYKTGLIANSNTIQERERFTIKNNSDGTVSFKASNGLFLSAYHHVYHTVQADSPDIGVWETFYIIYL